MLENIIQLVKDHAGEVLNNDPAIPANKKEAIIQTTGATVQDSLKSEALNSGIGAITAMFGNHGANPASLSGNSMVGNIAKNVTENLIRKVGLDQATAAKISTVLIPLVLSKLIHKTNDPKDNSFSLDGILSSITGGNSGGLLDNLKGLF